MTKDNTKHTPGPWEIRKDSGRACFTVVRPNAAALSYSSIAFEVLPQDAHLIAAAPDLLEALREVADRLEVHMKHSDDLVAHMRAHKVIAKAEGREVQP